MVKVFVPAPISSLSYIPLLYPQWGIQVHKNELYLDSVFQYFTENFVEIVDDIANADAILAPHFYTLIERKNPQYLKDVHELSLSYKKPLILFAYGDSAEEISLANTIVFRYSQYKSAQKQNEIIMPPVAPDIGSEVGIIERHKSDSVPLIGFCGWADYKNTSDALRAFLKNTYYEVSAFVTKSPLIRARKKGIYFRKKALTLFQNSPLVRTAFIVRNSHSLNKNLISLDPTVARKEFIENIQHVDLSLTTKGDGNAATRFYEILSLGHIPLVIDTDTSLPLEKLIPYDQFTVSIPFTEIESAPKMAHDWFVNMTDDAYREKQRMAREYYVKYLRMDAFLKYIFSSKEILFGSVTLEK
jgi:hypothetical protein